jgi:hypothetical protein
MKAKANASILIDYKSSRDGLKVYGKVKKVEPLKPGDTGFVEPLSKLSIDGDKEFAFYPAKWGYTWMIKVSFKQFNYLNAFTDTP